MGINKVQFQKGLSIAAFMDQYRTEEPCHATLVASRWAAGFVCASCGCTRHCTFVRKGLQYWRCTACREQTTVTCGTVFQATKLPLAHWFLAMQLLTQAKNNVSALELKRHLGVRYKTAWLMKHKLLQVMCDRDESRQLDGRVEIDDAYLGGESPGGKRGRGSENKVPFIAAVQTTDAGQPVLMCLKKLEFTKEAIAKWARQSLCASAQVVSDGWWCFQSVTVVGATHQRTVTGGGAASVKLEQFRAVNTVLGNLKTAFNGTYHAFDFVKYGHRYLAEVQYRFNRRFDLSVILARLLRAAVVTSPHPERLIRVAEHGGQSGFDLAKDQWPLMAQRIDELLHHQVCLTASTLSEQAQTLAQRYAAQMIALRPSLAAAAAATQCVMVAGGAALAEGSVATSAALADEGAPQAQADRFQHVDLDSIELARPRSVGVENAALCAMRQCGCHADSPRWARRAHAQGQPT